MVRFLLISRDVAGRAIIQINCEKNGKTAFWGCSAAIAGKTYNSL